MISISKISRAIARLFETTAKARLNSELLRMGRDRVEASGYSYEALRVGPDAWPWRKTTQEGADETGVRTRLCDSTRLPGSDRNDAGIVRLGIDQAPRHGRSGNDFGKDAA